MNTVKNGKIEQMPENGIPKLLYQYKPKEKYVLGV
jgi:hypothetical protein